MNIIQYTESLSIVRSVCGLGSLVGSGILSGGGGSVSANPGILGSSGMGSGGLVMDSLGNNGGMYSSRRSRSMDRGPAMGSRMDRDDRGSGMESRMSSGGNIYSSSSGGGGRMAYDRGPEYERGRADSMEYDRGGDRGTSDPYGKSEVSTVFVKNVSRLSLIHI